MSEPLPALSPVALLAERLSDKVLSAKRGNPVKIDALYAAALIAIPAVLRAGQDGNLQCQAASREMLPHLGILLKK